MPNFSCFAFLNSSRTLGVEIDGLKTQIADKRVALNDCRKSRVFVQSEIQPIAITPPTSSIPGVTTFVPIEPLSNDIPDDLKVVEGIGPKIEKLLNNEGILTFAQLATASPERIKEILVAAGTRFQMHDPTTWPQQSALARDGKLEELKTWQDELNKGRKE